MSIISSFSKPANIVIFGASGGIGNAIVEALAMDERAGNVIALSRTPPDFDSPKVTSLPVDIMDEASVAAIAGQCADAGPIDLVIVATGILHDGKRLRPEKRMQDLDAEAMAEVFRINTIAPAIIAKHFLPLMRRDEKTAFAAISARVGSIGDNRLGGWASYRASKAALNMLLKNLAIELARKHRDCAIVGLQPGTTDTALSAPFQRNVPRDQLQTPAYTARQLVRVMQALRSDDSGGLFDFLGLPFDP